MNLFIPKNYLLFTLVPLSIFSILLIGFPVFVSNLLGIDRSPTALMMLRFLGTSLVGHAYLNYHGRNLKGEALKLILLMNIVTLAVAVGVSIPSIASGAIPTIGSLILVMHITFLLGFLVSGRRNK